MLRMSKMADYATMILVAMAQAPERVRTAVELAASIGLPLPTVSKTLKILTREGLVVSLRGAKGGYGLARQPALISIAQIIDALDGPLGLTECSVAPGLCAHESRCQVSGNWQRVNRFVLQALQQVSLEQMAQSPVAPVAPVAPSDALRAARSAPCVAESE